MKRTVPDLKELFKQASEIAQQVPENMQQVAFNRAIDLLTGKTKEDKPDKEQQARGSTKQTAKKQLTSEVENDIASNLMSAIDSTQHPGVMSAKKVLDRALMILQIALNDHGIDGLMPSEIAKILTDKFRVSTTKNAVSMALGNATKLANRVSSGAGYRYRIMGPGEEYLAHQGENEEPSAVAPKKVSPKTAIKKKDNKRIYKEVQIKDTRPKGPVGPKAAVINLIDSGYFSENRTGPEVQLYLKNKRGFNIGIDQLRLAMLRLVRDEKLERDENAEGQYEYKQSKS